MNLDNPAALRYILQDDIYLLAADRESYLNRPEPSDTQTPEVSFKYLGEYKNKFLILSHYPQHEHMDPAHFTALESTLKRINLSLNEVAILNLAAHAGVNYNLIVEHLSPDKIVILGADALPAEAPFTTLNKPQQAVNINILYTHSFGEMMGNKENTKAFWNEIKNF